MLQVNFATGYNVPPYWANRPVQVIEPDTDGMEDAGAYLGNLYQDSVRMRFEGDAEWFTFTFDPVVSVTGKNIIVRRSVLKTDENTVRRGTVKELWSQDDYEINMAGLFKGSAETPETELRRLRAFCEARKIIEVESVLFSIFGITRVAIEEYALPFTKGIENQQWSIKAYSDDLFDLLIKENSA